jgi:hypothetical protein
MENYEIISPKDRLKYFGQEDHVRIYNLETLENRLTQNKFLVQTQHFSNDENNRMGFDNREFVILAKKVSY